jgi:Sulfotransferase family
MRHHTKLIEKARQNTGLDDFGDGSFVDGLERLLWSFDHEADLTETGTAALDDQIVDMLSQRLEVEQCLRTNPEIEKQEIKAPLIGLGLPRTGSTAFSYLLAEDPNVRCLRHWELYKLCPPPEAATQHTDPRIAKSEEMLKIVSSIFPRLKLMLPTSAIGPTECQQIMGHDFKSLGFSASARVPSYTKWLLYDADLVPTFRYLKRILKMLQWHCPPTRWRLKNPNHCLFLPALNEVFPDARFWMTHRDIAQVIPSVCNVYEELIQAYTNNVDRKWIAAMNIEWTELGMRRVMDFRDRDRQDHRFFDVQFEEFQSNPLPSIERLYAFLGEELTADARQNMERWWQKSSQEKGERPNYSLTGFDLDFQDLNQRFSDYSKRFSIRVRTLDS